MKFSIVITSYNRLTLLKRAVHSALQQTIACEVVVVDDCSNDGTQEYMTQLSESVPSLIYHRNQENLGHSQSVNMGVKKATGDWVKALDDDDYLEPFCVQMMSDAIALRPQAVICSAQALQVDEQENPLYMTNPVGPGTLCYIPQEDIHHGMLLEEVPFGTPAQVAFQREAFLKSGGWDSQLDANFDDIDSWIKIAQFGDALFINTCLAYRTVWSGSYNRKFSLTQRLNTHILIKRKIYDLIHPKYRDHIPTVQEIESYLKLHWSIVALKQGQVWETLRLLNHVHLSSTAWQLLLRRFQRDQNTYFKNPHRRSLLRFVQTTRKRDRCVDYKNFKLLKQYVQSRWGIKAFQQKQYYLAGKIILQALWSPKAWKLLLMSMLRPPERSLMSQTARIHPNHLTLLKIAFFLNHKTPQFLTNFQELHLYLKWQILQLALQQRQVGYILKYGLFFLRSPKSWKLLSVLWILQKPTRKREKTRKIALLDFPETPLRRSVKVQEEYKS